MPNEEVTQIFGNKVRLRVCGICLDHDSILLVNHRGVGPQNDLWIPPGGGMHFGESATEALQREFLEETGLEVQVGELMFVNEFIGPPLHAVELFFRVHAVGGLLRQGTDPEMAEQVITGVAFLPFEKVKQLPLTQVHNLFSYGPTLPELLQMRGYYQFRPQ